MEKEGRGWKDGKAVEDYGKCARKGRGGEDEKMEKQWKIMENVRGREEGERMKRWKSIGTI
jgi:hypothetical protein